MWAHLVRFFMSEGEQEAEDLASDVFTKIVESGATFATPGHALAYLWQTARTCRIDRIRRRAARPTLVQVEPTGVVYVDPNIGLFINEALSALTPEQRRVQVLAAAGYTNDEIAARTGTTTNAVKQLRQRAKHRLRRLT